MVRSGIVDCGIWWVNWNYKLLEVQQYKFEKKTSKNTKVHKFFTKICILFLFRSVLCTFRWSSIDVFSETSP